MKKIITKPTFLCLNYTRRKIPAIAVKTAIGFLFQTLKANKVLKTNRSKNPQIEDLVIVFVSSAESRKLNKKFRHKDYATDVLSFPAETSHSGLGELVLCPQVLKKQAKENHHSFQEEVLLMLVHGFLHLLDYDHEKNLKEERKMMKIQNKLFKDLKEELK